MKIKTHSTKRYIISDEDEKYTPQSRETFRRTL